MEIKHSVSKSGSFFRISIFLPKNNCELSAIIKSPSGREYVFLPSPEKPVQNASYPHSEKGFVTCTGKGKYQIIFQPRESGEHILNLIGTASGKTFKKSAKLLF